MSLQVNYTSASDMRFKDRKQYGVCSIQEKRNLAACVLHHASYILLFTVCCLLSAVCHAEVIDRVVAIVDDDAIMQSELEDAFQGTIKSGNNVTRENVLDGLINRTLLLKEARKFEYGAQGMKDDNETINEYIERRLKNFIRIPFEEIEAFYKENKASFRDKDFYDVRDEIENYLIEKELNKKLLGHIEELRKKAYIKIQLSE
ncbi:MAG: hypothetical protein HY758_11460 [Nitrospirae bacterium]|nr:hypothetical protein [Nitrospirota bacterium]